MKRILALGALALTAVLASEQEASAWVNCKFGVGLNWSWQSGGNNFLWGLFRNGQPPGPDCNHAPPPGYPGNAPFPNTAPYYGPQQFQYFGQQQSGEHQAPPAAQQQPVQAPAGTQLSYQNANPLYQPVSYNPYNNVNYAPAGYNPASYTSSYYGAAPSYWYGR